MSDAFTGEIRMMAFNYAPPGWAFCNGQTLPIRENQALFAILGTTYGGNGTNTFALPDLRGRVPVGTGQGTAGNAQLGQSAGEATHTLLTSEMPTHIHVAMGSSTAATAVSPKGNVWANQALNPYAALASGSMSPSSVSTAGGSQAHDNMQPYGVTNFCISVQGIFPSRD